MGCSGLSFLRVEKGILIYQVFYTHRRRRHLRPAVRHARGTPSFSRYDSNWARRRSQLDTLCSRSTNQTDVSERLGDCGQTSKPARGIRRTCMQSNGPNFLRPMSNSLSTWCFVKQQGEDPTRPVRLANQASHPAPVGQELAGRGHSHLDSLCSGSTKYPVVSEARDRLASTHATCTAKLPPIAVRPQQSRPPQDQAAVYSYQSQRENIRHIIHKSSPEGQSFRLNTNSPAASVSSGELRNTAKRSAGNIFSGAFLQTLPQRANLTENGQVAASLPITSKAAPMARAAPHGQSCPHDQSRSSRSELTPPSLPPPTRCRHRLPWSR